MSSLAAAAALLLAGCGADAPPQAAAGPHALRAAVAVMPPAVLAAASASGVPTPVPLAAPAPAPAAMSPAPAPGAEAPPARPLGGPLTAPAGGWRSRAVGKPNRGRLRQAVQLEAAGPHHLTWDPIRHRSPNREWRRWGTDRLVATIRVVAAEYRAANPDAPPLLVADLSRPRGGVFDARFGGLGHASHQNGLDVDIQYPRRDRRPIGPRRPSDVDLRLAQDLVDRFVAAGARYVFVGPRVRLRGPEGVVQPLVHHDDHLHVRLRP